MLRKLYLAQMCFGVALIAGPAQASLQDARAGAARPQSQVVAQAQLPKGASPDSRLFSNATLDPARCNYEYVDMYGAWVVRTELKLTCTTHH